MAELALEKDLRLALKAQAHALSPVVLLGSAGLTDAIVAEVDRALTAHSLIKVRVPLDDRADREAVFVSLADRVGAGRVQAIGKLIVLYRPPPPDSEEEATSRDSARTKRNAARSGKGSRRERHR
jgi:RNA-binding protein